MEKSISTSLSNVIKENSVKKEDFSVVKGYYEAIKLYDNLVSNGLAVKRGNNLKSIDKTVTVSIKFNAINV
jgi:hypothetical protein